MKRSNMKFSTKLVSLVLVSIGILLAFALVSYTTLNRLRVDGPVFKQIVMGKDLVADILPPPEYIIEAYLVSLQMLEETGADNIRALIEKEKSLKAEYVQRHQYWVRTLHPGRMKDIFVQQSYTPAMAFFSLMDSQFIPAIEKGDKAKARQLAAGAMHDQYALHRKAIEKVVKLANEANATIQSEAESTIKVRTFFMFAIAFIGILGLCALAYFVIRDITGPLGKVISGLTESSGQVGAASGQISSASQLLADGASEQAASIEETSSSLEELSAMTLQNAENAKQADTLMNEANEAVQTANESMVQLNASMEEISTASAETQKIVKTIDEIAFQTNLLALNAAIEAARAGEAGAGFAVVADEVRSLAMRAAQAAKNTADMIEGTIDKVLQGSDLATATSDAFGKVSNSATKVGELVAEIAVASKEQSDGISQINRAVADMDSVVQRNAASAEENSSASEQMSAQAMQMREYVGELALMVSGSSALSNGGQRRSGGHPPMALRRRAQHSAPAGGNGKALTVHARKRSGIQLPAPSEDSDFSDF